MSGRYLLDTNGIIALLQGNKNIINILADAEWVGISIISQLEFLAFPNLSTTDKDCFYQFLKRVDVIGLNRGQKNLIDFIINLRQNYKIKLPDAIIAGTAINCNSDLISADLHLKQIKELKLISF